jgi:hypothetical protein
MRERPRLFTLEEAQALLPGLKEILEKMQARKHTLDLLSAQIEDMSEATAGNGHSSGSKMVSLRHEAERAAADLEALAAELHATGCELKGIDQGLVDFPSERNGRVVYLCWRLGEDTISYWHELDTGFAGRQPLES